MIIICFMMSQTETMDSGATIGTLGTVESLDDEVEVVAPVRSTESLVDIAARLRKERSIFNMSFFWFVISFLIALFYF